MTPAPTMEQIRAQVTAIRQKVPDARVIGIHAPGRWTGEPSVTCQDETYLIHQCDSPLAMRMALRETIVDAVTHILITPLEEKDLGDDILVRLARRRLFAMDSWQIVIALFGANSIDPRIARRRWIAESLLDWSPSGGNRAAAGGFLDAETVWPILLRRGIGLTAERPDLSALLAWSVEMENVRKFREQPEEFRTAAAEWIAASAGPAAYNVLRCIELCERADALPVGLAAAIIFHGSAAGPLDRSAGRMEERFLGGQSPDGVVMRRWSEAADAAIRQFTDSGIERVQLQRADEILYEVGAEGFAHLSDTSPLGFDQRMAALGKCLQQALHRKTPEALTAMKEASAAVFRHHLTSREGRRIDRLRMADRLIRWIYIEAADVRPPQSFSEAAAYHITDGGFLDRARLALRCGDPVPELSLAFNEIFVRVTDLREIHSRQFAMLLRDSTAAGSTPIRVMPVEHVLAEVVAPLAARTPVLVIVLDGMSAAVCRELLSDITQHDWVVLCPEDSTTTSLVGLAALPSVTEMSRTSLLCGRLRRGSSDDEKKGFVSHPALRARCGGKLEPILFHKPALQQGDGASLAPEVRDAIGTSERRVVGVVVNAIDDQLLRGEQVDTRWTRDTIKALPILLHEARAADRLVILVSDHGHVLEYKTPSRNAEGGERWRIDDGSPHPDEFRISGSRVVMPETGSFIAPWSERIRYGVKRNGYHGGLTPQEMVVPIVVLASKTPYPQGWTEAPVDTPEWWEEPLPMVRQPVYQLREPRAMSENPDLFSQPDPFGEGQALEDGSLKPVSEWITRLLASPVLYEQVRLASKMAPPEQALAQILDLLDRSGGRMSFSALSRTLGVSPGRLRDLITAAQRVLNIDGYAVLTRDSESDRVQLDRSLLLQSFDLT